MVKKSEDLQYVPQDLQEAGADLGHEHQEAVSAARRLLRVEQGEHSLRYVELITPDNEEAWAEASAIEAAVFIKAGYVKDQDELEKQYEPYKPASTFVRFREVDNETGELTTKGVLRLVHHMPGVGFKTLKDAKIPNVKGETLHIEDERWPWIEAHEHEMLEVGTVSVPEQFRTKDSGRASLWLYGAVVAWGRQHNAPIVIASFDENYFQGFNALFPEGIEPLGEPKEYMGSLTRVVMMDREVTHKSIRKVAGGEEAYDTIVKGIEAIEHR